jgi:hypothetical protein
MVMKNLRFHEDFVKYVNFRLWESINISMFPFIDFINRHENINEKLRFFWVPPLTNKLIMFI